MIVLGDHQPHTYVTGTGVGHDVPITLIAHDPAVLHRIAGGTGSRPAALPGRARVADGLLPRPLPVRVRPGARPPGRRTRPVEVVVRSGCEAGMPSCMSRRNIFVLSGGGSRGAGQVGMLRVLGDAGIVPDVLVGGSVGAINACFVGLAPDPGGARGARRQVAGDERGGVVRAPPRSAAQRGQAAALPLLGRPVPADGRGVGPDLPPRGPRHPGAGGDHRHRHRAARCTTTAATSRTCSPPRPRSRRSSRPWCCAAPTGRGRTWTPAWPRTSPSRARQAWRDPVTGSGSST